MNKTNVGECENKIAVDINGLQMMLSVGKGTASDIGERAGAVVRFGKRKLYIVKKVEAYMDSLAEA